MLFDFVLFSTYRNDLLQRIVFLKTCSNGGFESLKKASVIKKVWNSH